MLESQWGEEVGLFLKNFLVTYNLNPLPSFGDSFTVWFLAIGWPDNVSPSLKNG